MKKKISVIIPVYNVERYLRKCLDSVVRQTLQDIEIICINDGSQDGSLDILNEYRANDERILVIDQKNMGVESARAAGMKVARGEFIHFCDPDDWCLNNMYEKMYNAALNSQADFVICNTICLNEDNSVYIDRTNRLNVDFYGNVDSATIKNVPLSATWRNVLWNKIFKKCIIDRYNIKFPYNTQIKRGFDSIFNTIFMNIAQTCCCMTEALYVNCQHPGSLTMDIIDGISKNYYDTWYSYQYLYKFIEDNDLDQTVFDNCISVFYPDSLVFFYKLQDWHKKTESMRLAKDIFLSIHSKYGNGQKLLTEYLDWVIHNYLYRLIQNKTFFIKESKNIHEMLKNLDTQLLNFDKKNITTYVKKKNYIIAYYLTKYSTSRLFAFFGIPFYNNLKKYFTIDYKTWLMQLQATSLSGKDVYFWGCGKTYRRYSHLFSKSRSRYILFDLPNPPKRVDGIPVIHPAALQDPIEKLPVVVFTHKDYRSVLASKLKRNYKFLIEGEPIFVVDD